MIFFEIVLYSARNLVSSFALQFRRQVKTGYDHRVNDETERALCPQQHRDFRTAGGDHLRFEHGLYLPPSLSRQSSSDSSSSRAGGQSLGRAGDRCSGFQPDCSDPGERDGLQPRDLSEDDSSELEWAPRVEATGGRGHDDLRTGSS